MFILGSVSDITGTASEIDWGSSVSDLSLSGTPFFKFKQLPVLAGLMPGWLIQ